MYQRIYAQHLNDLIILKILGIAARRAVNVAAVSSLAAYIIAMMDLHMTPLKQQPRNTLWQTSLPAFAYCSLNRCNLPAVILGSLTYQQHPTPLRIDGVHTLHRAFFHTIDQIASCDERAVHFRQYMCAAFLLDDREAAGQTEANRGIRRDKCDYLRLLRGWLFNPDGIEAAVIKRWVESRFGLLTISHRGLLDNTRSEAYQHFHADYVRGLYNSNALEAQLDLLYSYCQYELQRRWPERSHWSLYRGINHIKQHKQLNETSADPHLLLNNINSFSDDRHLCETFGDVIIETQVPVAKLLYFPSLLHGILQGESEYLAIGGVYQARIIR